jgi:hypothetical protein
MIDEKLARAHSVALATVEDHLIEVTADIAAGCLAEVVTWLRGAGAIGHAVP